LTEQDGKVRSTPDAILDAAIDLFIETGFETTSMDAIALKAGVAKGTLYYHFKSKEGIVEAIVERFVVGAERAFTAIVEDRAKGPFEKLEAITERMTELNIASFTKLHRMKYIDIHMRTQKAMVTRFAPFYARILEEGNARGLWKAEYPLELAEISIAANSFLFDPECSGLTSEKLEGAMIDLMAKGMNIEASTLASVFSSFTEYVRSALPGSAGR
jgi:AcrR family transcriptional regulator